MKKLFIALMICLFASVAFADVCVEMPKIGTMCKSQCKGLPKDFPDELFLKWIPNPHFETQAIASFYTIGWFDEKTQEETGRLFFTVDGQDAMAFAFVEMKNGYAIVTWVAEDSKKEDRELLILLVKTYNEFNAPKLSI